MQLHVSTSRYAAALRIGSLAERLQGRDDRLTDQDRAPFKHQSSLLRVVTTFCFATLPWLDTRFQNAVKQWM